MNLANLLASLGHRRAKWVVLLLIVLVSLPALFAGWQHDDYIHQTLLHGLPSAQRRSPDELYCFAGGPQHRPGSVTPPWWQTPSHSACFFRPLSSLSLAIDHTHLTRAPVLAHVHSLLWFLILCGAVFALARRLLPPAQATLGLLIYGVSGFSVSTIAWLAARHAVVSSAIAAWGLVAYVGGRQDQRWPRVVVGLLLLTLALLAGEGALTAFGFVAAYECLLADDARPRRALALASAAALALLYVRWYAHAGYGMAGVGIYLDPIRYPREFLVALPGRLLALLADAVAGIPSALWHFAAYQTLLALWGVLSLGLLSALLLLSAQARDAQQRRLLRFLGLGALAAAIPTTAAVLGGRLLMLPGIGLCFLCAILLHPASPSAPAGQARWPRLLRGLRWVLAILVLGANPLMRVTQSIGLRQLADSELRISESFLAPCDTADHYYLLGSEDFTVAMFAPYLLQEPLRRKEWRQITLASSDIAIEALSDRSLRLRAEPPGLLLGGFVYELMRPARTPLLPGQRVPIGLGEIHVEQASPQGVSVLRLDLSVPYHDGAICWLRFDGKTVTPLAITAQPGGDKQIVPRIQGALPF